MNIKLAAGSNYSSNQSQKEDSMADLDMADDYYSSGTGQKKQEH
jgi:hypothetical protein